MTRDIGLEAGSTNIRLLKLLLQLNKSFIFHFKKLNRRACKHLYQTLNWLSKKLTCIGYVGDIGLLLILVWLFLFWATKIKMIVYISLCLSIIQYLLDLMKLNHIGSSIIDSHFFFFFFFFLAVKVVGSHKSFNQSEIKLQHKRREKIPVRN